MASADSASILGSDAFPVAAPLASLKLLPEVTDLPGAIVIVRAHANESTSQQRKTIA
jgi:hypothetical protein